MDSPIRTRLPFRPNIAVVVTVEALIWASVVAYFAVLTPALGLLPGPASVTAWLADSQSPRQWIPVVAVMLIAARIIWAAGESEFTAQLRLPRPFPLFRTRARILAVVLCTAATAVFARYVAASLAGQGWLWPVVAGAAAATAHSVWRARVGSRLRSPRSSCRTSGVHTDFLGEGPPDSGRQSET